MTKLLLSILAVIAMIAPACAAEALPGDACSAANNLQFTSGPEVSGGGGHALLCQGGTWKSILSFNSSAGLTKLGNQVCATNEILKFNGTTWACAADASGSGADNLGNHIATTVLRSDTHNTDDLGTTAIRWKDGWFAGTVTGGTFAGSGASLTSLPAANITGTLPAISGANLTTLNATNLASGTVAAARMPALTGDVTMAAGTTATTIAANAVTTTEIAVDTIAAADIAPNAVATSELADDAVTIPKLAATGTASASTFLRGDNTWAAAGGGISGSISTVSCTAFRNTCTASCPAGTLRTGCAIEGAADARGPNVSGAQSCACTSPGSAMAGFDCTAICLD